MIIFRSSGKGFTIVELLIVIVVIAILATVTIVAYTGIQNRANDVVIQNDVNNLTKVISQYETVNGGLPRSGWQAGNSTAFPGVSFKPSKGAYNTATDNLFYCTGTRVSTGQQSFIIAARSKSGTIFTYSPESGMQSTINGSVSSNCLGTGNSIWQGTGGTDYGYSYGYYNAGNNWWSWTN